jgi:hypothetical protein
MPVFCSSQPHRPCCGRLVAGQRKEGSGAGTNGGAPAELLRAEAVPEARWEPTRQHEAAILAHRRPVNTAITMLPAASRRRISTQSAGPCRAPRWEKMLELRPGLFQPKRRPCQGRSSAGRSRQRLPVPR